MENVIVVNSIDKLLDLVEKMGLKKLFVSGGAKTNNEFMKKGIVDTLILNYNPYVLNKGINLFDGEEFEYKLNLQEIRKEKDGIIQVKYSIKNKYGFKN